MADVSNRQRQPSGIPQGGEFKNEQKGLDADDLVDAWQRTYAESDAALPSDEEMMRVLMGDGMDGVDTRRAIAETPNMPPELLKQLADHKDEIVRQNVACNPNTPPEALAWLTEDKDYADSYAACNPNTPPEALAKLAEDKSQDMSWEVADNPNTPPEALLKLAEDEDKYVRERVAENPNTPPETLDRLASNKSIACDSVALNPNMPPATLARLAEEGDWDVRQRVAKTPTTPTETLDRLAKDKNGWTRLYVACNPNASSATVEQVINDNLSFTKGDGKYDWEEEVERLDETTRVFFNPSLSDEALWRLSRSQYSNISVPAQAARWLRQNASKSA